MSAFLIFSACVYGISVVSEFVCLMLNHYPRTSTKSVRTAVLSLMLSAAICAWAATLIWGVP